MILTLSGKPTSGPRQQLMHDLHVIENDIQNRRVGYNGAVKAYNTFCNSLPFSLVASSLGFNQAPYFNVENADSLENLKDFVTDDGTILRQKLTQVGAQVIHSGKALGNSIEQNGRILLDKGKEEINRRRQAPEEQPPKEE